MVCRERRVLICTRDFSHSGWQPLAGGSWLFVGDRFCDERGTGDEICDFVHWPPSLEPFIAAQENVVTTHKAGCARGLHYQVEPHAQAKLVTLLRGSAQFFWFSMESDASPVEVNSIVLVADGASLYTPPEYAHGMLALADHTQFLMRMSKPISLPHRGAVSFMAKSLSIQFARPLREELLSPRDRDAPEWIKRSPSTAAIKSSYMTE